MHEKKHLTLILLLIIGLGACKKSSTSDPKSTTTAKKNVDVYVVGASLAANGLYVATYWKNGVATRMSDSSYESNGEAIAVEGSDIYVTGQSSEGAAYWKNGAPKIFPYGSFANAIAVNGNDVYLAGFGYFSKNGVFIKLDKVYDTNTVVINGTDVYVVGATKATNGNTVAAYWKNGVLKTLADSSLLSYAKGMTFQGSNVYVSGYTNLSTTGPEVATYWKNDVRYSLPDTAFSNALSIAVNGSDVYLAGHVSGTPGTNQSAYWKNGELIKIGNPGFAAYANTIAVNGTDVYVTGSFGNNETEYWKNNGLIKLANTQTVTNGVLLVPQ